MCDYCNCCVNNQEWVRNHLNWELTTDADWEKEANDCIIFWGKENMPDADELSGLLQEVYS